MNRMMVLGAICLLTPNLVHADAPGVTRLEIHPNDERVLHAPADSQQLAVIAHFSDGAVKDVTRLTSFQSSDTDVASVLPTGRVRFHKTGEIGISCRYRIVASVKLTYVATDAKFVWPNPPAPSLIDHLVFTQLKRLQLPPSDLCEDHVFLRRAYLDVCGILPTPNDVRRFMDDRHPLKRARVIEELLERPEYADYWAFQWYEALGMTRNLDRNSGAAVLRWFRTRVKDNTPLDQLARDLVHGAAIETDNGLVTYYTGANTPAEWAERTATAFLGVRLDCVRCHSHPHARWTPGDRDHFAAFFAQLDMKRVNFGGKQRGVLVFDRAGEWLHPLSKQPIAPRFLDGASPKFIAGDDRRTVLASWLTSAKNPYFARTMVNRIWANLFGRGIADPPDMIHELPLSANDPLLDALAKSFIAERFDVKQMIRILMNSRTYQLSSTHNEGNKNDTKYFSRTYPKHLRAEVLCDVIDQVLETPETFTGLPRGTRAIHVLHAFEPIFWLGRRGTECEREENVSAVAANLHILNHDKLQRQLKDTDNRANRLLLLNKSDRAIEDELFLACIARLPTPDERNRIADHRSTTLNRAVVFQDVLFALLNTREFIQRR